MPMLGDVALLPMVRLPSDAIALAPSAVEVRSMVMAPSRICMCGVGASVPVVASAASRRMPLVSCALTVRLMVPPFMMNCPLSASSDVGSVSTWSPSPCVLAMVIVPPFCWKYSPQCMPSDAALVMLMAPVDFLRKRYSLERSAWRELPAMLSVPAPLTSRCP